MAAMVHIELMEQVLAERGARFEVVDRIRERTTGYSEEGIACDVDEAVTEVREAKRKRDACAQGDA